MLEYFLTVIQQIFSMFLMVMVGFVMSKLKMISENGTKELSTLLLKIVTPMILVSSFQRQFEEELLLRWLIMFAASALTYFVHIALAELFYRKRDEVCAENKLSIVLPNNGFLAFPLLQALAGELGIFFGSASVIILNILMWTYGTRQMRPSEKMSIRKIISNPGVISIVLGLILFCSPWKLPTPVYNAVSAIGSLNTPVAMIVLGAMLAQTDFKKGLTQISYYKISVIKLIIAPIIMMAIFIFLPIPDDVKLVAFVCSVTPTATAVSMAAQIYDRNYKYATNAVVITTVLSAITMPLILTVGKIVLGY